MTENPRAMHKAQGSKVQNNTIQYNNLCGASLIWLIVQPGINTKTNTPTEQNDYLFSYSIYDIAICNQIMYEQHLFYSKLQVISPFKSYMSS